MSFVVAVVPTAWDMNNKLEEVMRILAKKLHRFLASEDGPTAVEYAVMLALIVVVCLGAIGGIGTQANIAFESIESSLTP